MRNEVSECGLHRSPAVLEGPLIVPATKWTWHRRLIQKTSRSPLHGAIKRSV